MNLSAIASTSSSITRCSARLSSNSHLTWISHKINLSSASPLSSRRRTFVSTSSRTFSSSFSSTNTSPTSSTSSSLPDPSLPSRQFTFHVGASFIGKPASNDDGPPPASKPFPPEHPVVGFRDKMLAWPREVPSEEAGHDFFFVQNMKNKSGIALGVADGVGGWGDILDPGLFSQALMYYASEAASKNWPGEPESDPTSEDPVPVSGHTLDPVQCLDQAFRRVKRDNGVEGGASTACIMTLDAVSGKLKAANLGDSGFYVIRGSNMIHAQPAQQHYFNCPVQLSKLPLGFKSDGAFSDTPKDADTFSLGLRHGDIIVAYTDGLSDNVYRHEVLDYVRNVMRRPGSPPVTNPWNKSSATKPDSTGQVIIPHEDQLRAQFLADFLVIHARRCMFDFGRVSPFEEEWAKHQKSKRVYRGGKIDDVSVLVVVVQEGS